VVKKTKSEPDDYEQSQRFIETAKSLEVNENGKSFENTIKLVVKKVIPIRQPVKQTPK